MHLFGGPFEQPPAAHRKQGITDESHGNFGNDEGDMAERVPRHVPNLGGPWADRDPAPFGQAMIEPSEFGPLGLRAPDLGARRGLHIQDTTRVIGMPMRNEDLVDAPAALRSAGQRS